MISALRSRHIDCTAAGMSLSSILSLAALLALTSAAYGCAPPPQAAPPLASAHPTAAAAPPQSMGGERHVYRFDFVLSANDGTTPATSTAFTLNLQEFEKGEMVVGKNVALTPGGTTAAGSPMASPRQDVGMKVAAAFRMSGDELLLDVSTEMSAFEPPSSIRKVVSKGNALATAGKPTLVTTLENDNKKYQLTVTPTKLR